MPWAVAATAVVGAYSSYQEQKDKEDARKDEKDMSELGFQRRSWLDQQQRKWNLEDRKYKEDSIGGFRSFAPESARTFNGQPVVAPTPTSTSGLAEFDPNKPGAIHFGLPDDPKKPKPLMGGE